MKTLILLLLLLVPLGAQADQAFNLENKEAGADFYVLDVQTATGQPVDRGQLLTLLDAQKPTVKRLSAGDWLAVYLAAGHALLGGWVATSERFSYREVLNFGWILAADVPFGRTVFLTRENFAAVNQSRLVELTPQEAGIKAPLVVIDGKMDDWERVEPLATYLADFVPPKVGIDALVTWENLGQEKVPEGAGRVRTIKTETQGSQLYLQVGEWEAGMPAEGKSYFFYLFDERVKEQPNRLTLEIVLGAKSGPVWLWKAGLTKPVKAGFWVRSGENLEAEVDLSVLGPEITAKLAGLSVDFSQFLRHNGQNKEYYYSTLSLNQLKR